MSNMQNTILISTGLAASLPLIPVGHFLRFGWATRKQQIVSRFSTKSIELYRQTFYPESDFKTSEEFKNDYDKRYGRRLFVFPVLWLTLTLFFTAYLSMSWVFSHDWMTSSEGTPRISIYSLAGAYVWITYDLILRVRQNDVVTSDINRATLRLLVSIPFGFAITAFAGVLPGTSVTLGAGALAFFVGAFPTDTVLKFMRRTAAAPLKLDADASEDNVKLLTDNICGVSVPIAERFIDEGVRTPLQLAYCDPIALTIKSGMDFSFILDCCGQALVRMYFTKDQMTIVRKYGLRTGIEVKTLYIELPDYSVLAEKAALAPAQTPGQAATAVAVAATPAAATTDGAPAPVRGLTPIQAQADKMLTDFSGELQLDSAAIRFIFDQIAGDPYTQFAWDIWGQTPTGSPDAKPCTPETDLSRRAAKRVTARNIRIRRVE